MKDLSPVLESRLRHHAAEWRVDVDSVAETKEALVAFGRRGDQPVVIKAMRSQGRPWNAGAILDAFGGRGVVRLLDQADGALLLERLSPGTPLTALCLSGRDREATIILGRVIAAMTPASMPDCPQAQDWGESFTRYRASTDRRIPVPLVVDAARIYEQLCASQRSTRLLHGDLHHANVLFDDARGWVAIDPKGVMGELEYELGASLRNPMESPALFAARGTIERRLDSFTAELPIDRDRALGWAFAQAVLATIWEVEDGTTVDGLHPFLQFAQAIRPMLSHRDS